MFSLLSVILTLFLSVTEIVPDGERLYLGGDAYSAPMVYQRDNGGNWTVYNIGRFLSPDPYIQSPDFTQNFNSYSYCLNNPLKYTDESGELIFTTAVIVGICVGTAIGAGVGAYQGYKIAERQDLTGSDRTWTIIGGGLSGALIGGVV